MTKYLDVAILGYIILWIISMTGFVARLNLVLHSILPFDRAYWKWLRLFVLTTIDVFIVASSYWLAFCLRIDPWDIGSYESLFYRTLPFVCLLFLASFHIGGMYRQFWRHANYQSIKLIFKSSFLAMLVFMASSYLTVFDPRLPRSIPIIHFLLTAMIVSMSRYWWRTVSSTHLPVAPGGKPKCVIYGAGSAGELLLRHINANARFPYDVVGFLDDDPSKKGLYIHGKRILGSGKQLFLIAQKFEIKTTIIAVHSAPGRVIREIVQRCKEAGVVPLIMPEVANTLGKDVILPRSIDIQDLLRRAPQPVDRSKITALLEGQVVLITGAGGSIGSELSRQVLSCRPQTLVLIDSSEYNLYKVDSDLREILTEFPADTSIVSILGDITDADSLSRSFARYSPKIVLHAAAYKHVPIIECNPLVGIINNVLGTKNLAELSIQFGVENFLLVSTDKAVNPTNVMGGTKRCCELLIQSIDKVHRSRCKFMAVRFGNVLGSSGSVIPRFLEQIQNGGPVTVTDPEVTRYFMLTSEAVGLVLQVASLAKGGEIFVLDMGEPVKIYEMAQQLIMLAGKIPGKDIEVRFTGLRPGEKLYEELTLKGIEKTTLHENLLIAQSEIEDPAKTLQSISDLLSHSISGDVESALRILKSLTYAQDVPSQSASDLNIVLGSPFIKKKRISSEMEWDINAGIQ